MHITSITTLSVTHYNLLCQPLFLQRKNNTTIIVLLNTKVARYSYYIGYTKEIQPINSIL